MAEPKRWLIVLTAAPYTDPRCVAGIDIALAAGAFAQSVSVLFRGAALAVLAAGQTPPPGAKHLGKQVSALPLYDVEALYADGDLPSERQDPALAVTPIDAPGVQTLIARADHVLVF